MREVVSGSKGDAAAAARGVEFVWRRFTESFSSVEDLGEERYQQGPEGHDEYHKGRYVVRQVPEMCLQESSFLFRPLCLGVPRFHKQPHEPGDLIGFVEK